MRQNFPHALKLVLADEGGNVDDPDDHGGRTSRGIIQRVYTAWLKEKGRPNADVWTAPQADIDAIYFEDYWQPNCDRMPAGVDYLYFNMAVNAGPYRATVLLQRALGVHDDGRFGPVTRQALVGFNAPTLIDRFCRSAEKFYRSLGQPKYLRGWINRNNRVRANALKMLEDK